MNTIVTFLHIMYGHTGFVINREQICSSILLEDLKEIESNLQYLKGIIQYKDNKVLLFDLERYLWSAFRISAAKEGSLVFITETKNFSENNLAIIDKFDTGNQICAFEKNYIALRVGNDATAIKRDIHDLRNIPQGIRNSQYKAGIIGLNFFGDGRINYLIDIESIIFNKLLVENKEESV